MLYTFPQGNAAQRSMEDARTGIDSLKVVLGESTALGSPWPAPPHASQPQGPELDRVLDLAEAEGPSRLPLR